MRRGHGLLTCPFLLALAWSWCGLCALLHTERCCFSSSKRGKVCLAVPVLPLLARRTATGMCSRPRRLEHRALSLPGCRCTGCPFRRRGAAVPSAAAVPSLTSALPRREHCVTVQGTAQEHVQSHTHGAVQTPSRRVRRAWRMGCSPCLSTPSHCCSLQSMSAALGTGRLFPQARRTPEGVCAEPRRRTCCAVKYTTHLHRFLARSAPPSPPTSTPQQKAALTTTRRTHLLQSGAPDKHPETGHNGH